jgi:hypothetical protein
MKSYKLLKQFGILEAGSIIQPLPLDSGRLLVERGIAEEITDERGGKDETNKAFQSPPKTKQHQGKAK